MLDTEGYLPARITAVHRERYEIVTDRGYAFAKLKSGIYFAEEKEEFPTVGDFVLIQYNELGDSLIVKTLERKAIFERKDPSSKLHKSEESDISQAVAANFDYVFILTSINHDLNIGRIERYLTLSWQSGAIPVIVLTKADLKEDYSEELNKVVKVAGNAMVHVVSSKSGQGIEELQEYFKPRKTIVFLGSSGMRELGMWDVSEGIGETFKDIESLLGKCKFTNCTHTNEPGCRILQAIEDEELSEERWSSYLKILKDSVVIDKKTRALQGKEFGRSMKKFKKEMQRSGKYKR